MLRVLLVGDRDDAVTAHRGIDASLASFGREASLAIAADWPGTEAIGSMPDAELARYHGFWCVPASPYASMEGALRAIRHARAAGMPFLGTCGGFQHALLEFSRNALGLLDAAHAETTPDAPDPVIAPLSCSLVERSGAVELDPGSRAAGWAGGTSLHEAYHCSYGLAPAHRPRFLGGDLRIVGWDPEGDARVVEHTNHPFFLATLFQPERKALGGVLHPLVRAFLAQVTAMVDAVPLSRG